VLMGSWSANRDASCKGCVDAKHSFFFVEEEQELRGASLAGAPRSHANLVTEFVKQDEW